MNIETDRYREPLAYYLQVRREQKLKPQWAYTAALQRYACNTQDYQKRYKVAAVWLKRNEQRKRDEAIERAQVWQERKTAVLTAMANQCRDNGYGAARRDKLGITQETK